jgi:two-component system chemotaxis response regulator CheY
MMQMSAQRSITLDLVIPRAGKLHENILPDHRDDSRGVVQAISARAKAPAKNQLLYFEENRDIREIIFRFLTLEGYSVFCAQSAAEAEALARVEWFDLYLIGDCIPLGSNINLIRRIKSRDFYTPLILHSTQCFEDDIEKGIEAGARIFVKKLTEIDYLLENVRELIGNAEYRPIRYGARLRTDW